MDNPYNRQPLAGWFMLGACASILFMAVGCVALAAHLATDPASLPLDQRALFEAEPDWVLAASAVGFIAGLAGALMLLLRRRSAVPLLIFSLAAMLIWAAGMFATPSFRNLLSTDQIAMVAGVVAVTWTIYWFGRHSGQRGWLR